MNNLRILTLFSIIVYADVVIPEELEFGFGELCRLTEKDLTQHVLWIKMVHNAGILSGPKDDDMSPLEETPEFRRFVDENNALRIKNNYPGLQEKKGPLKVKGGEITNTDNYPYMAAIMVNGRLWCAGAIVDVNWILTAAHCLNYVLHVSPMKTLGRYVKVRVGSAKAHEGGNLMDVAGAVRHPKFEEEPVPHADIALLKLTTNLELSRTVSILQIYAGRREPYAQSFIVVSGWGATRGSATAFREQTSDLLSARLKVRTQHYCIDSYQLVNNFLFTEDFFCASLRNGTRDACLFDAGAPAVQHNKLMGIMSFGPERCGGPQPAVFIKAFYFRDFVKTTISAYKSTKDLIAVMGVIDPTVKPKIHHVDQVYQGVEQLEEVTRPDEKHDRKK